MTNTQTFEFNPDGKYTILSIDGGGMRGTIPLEMLVYLEDKTGKPAYELFDMVAGTSTGAIIGAAMGLGMSAHDIMDELYMTRLPKAFGPYEGSMSLFKFAINRLRHFYSDKPFLTAVQDITRGKYVKDFRIIVLMTATDLRTGNTYYITNRGTGAGKFLDWPVTGAVGASAAAPIFFPPPLGNFIDGGIGAFGNPCLAATIEAIDYIADPDFTEENTIHISLGTGFVPDMYRPGQGVKFWLKNWVEYMILYPIANIAVEQARNTARFYKNLDFRRYNVLLSRDNLMNNLGIDPGDIEPRTLTLDSRRKDELMLMRQIGRAYAEAIDWRPQHYENGNIKQVLAWDTKGGRKKPEVMDVDWTGSPYDA